MKLCAICERLLALVNFYRRGTGHHSYCKLCHRGRTLELRAIRAQARAAA